MFKIFFERKNRNFVRLWLAQVISQFGDRIHQLALVGLIAERSPGNAMDLAKVLAFTIIPVFVVQPFAGVFVDRWDRRTTLFICDIVRGFLVCLIPICFIRWHTMLPIYGIVFFVFCFSRFYIPAKMSIIPDLVTSEQLLLANSLVSTTGMIAFVIGCALGGFLIDRLGARTGFQIDAVTFFVSAALVFSINMRKTWKNLHRAEVIAASKKIVRDMPRSIWHEMREGWQYILTQKDLRFIIFILFMLLAGGGAIYSVLIVFIQQSFNSVTRDLGVLAVCLGIGLFAGAVAYGKWGRNVPWYRIIFLCLILGGFMLFVFAASVQLLANMWMAMGLAVLMGFVIGPIFIAANTATQVVSDPAMRGKVFSALEIVIHAAFLLSMLLSSWLSTWIKPVWILCSVATLFAVLGLAGLKFNRYFIKR